MNDPLDKESADGRILYLYLGGAVVFNAFVEAQAKGEPFCLVTMPTGGAWRGFSGSLVEIPKARL